MRDAVGFNDLLLEVRHTLRGTNFRNYNDLLDGARGLGGGRSGGGGAIRLGANDQEQQDGSARYVRATTELTFPDVSESDETERLFAEAKRLEDGDYGYRVIAPGGDRGGGGGGGR